MILCLPVGFCSRQVLEHKGKHYRKEEVLQELMGYEDLNVGFVQDCAAVKKSKTSGICVLP